MPAATAARLEGVNAFPFGDAVLFKHYFDSEAVFDRLQPYYNGSQYRFGVDTDEFDSLRRFLGRHGYEVTVVDRPADYWVVVRRYTDHPEDIFKRSVRQERLDRYNGFLMKDRSAVESAVSEGAKRLSDVPVSLSTGTLDDFVAPSV
jgi:hypothetical protein